MKFQIYLKNANYFSTIKLTMIFMKLITFYNCLICYQFRDLFTHEIQNYIF
jgi:hypothetical protein